MHRFEKYEQKMLFILKKKIFIKNKTSYWQFLTIKWQKLNDSFYELFSVLNMAYVF